MKQNAKPAAAMVLAAGLGKRMRPITDTIPKPLVRVAGKTLLDWGLDSLAEAGVSRAIVNVHYFPEQIVAHVAGRSAPVVSISDESVERPSSSSTRTPSGSTGTDQISTGLPLHGTLREWICC